MFSMKIMIFPNGHRYPIWDRRTCGWNCEALPHYSSASLCCPFIHRSITNCFSYRQRRPLLFDNKVYWWSFFLRVDSRRPELKKSTIDLLKELKHQTSEKTRTEPLVITQEAAFNWDPSQMPPGFENYRKSFFFGWVSLWNFFPLEH